MLDQISKRLDKLISGVAEEGGRIDALSLSSFLNFAELLSDKTKNSIVLSLTPDNEIYATCWHGGKKHCMTFKKGEYGVIEYFVM